MKIKILLILAMFKMANVFSQTVFQVITDSPDHNTLEAAVGAANLGGTLSGAGPFTVFAPTDAAFAALPAGTVQALLADPMGALTQVLLYHTVSANALSTSLSNGQTIATINGKNVFVNINSNGVFINNVKVTVADVVATNGVVHVVDAVLVPPTGSVVDVIVNSPDHTTLEAAVVAAGLAPTLSGAGPFTVFAPTDAAFAALPPGTVQALLADPMGALSQILLYHATGNAAFSRTLKNGQAVVTVNGKNVFVNATANGVFINNVKVSVADIVATNGVVHVIDAVLIPPTGSVVDVIVNSPDHTTLEAAVVAAGLAPTLSGTGPFTVFAPTDAAFAALPAGTVQALLADPTGALTQILLYHAVGSAAFSNSLSNNQVIKTINGKNVTVTINANGVFINNAKVTVADIVADNGVVHVIDAVLIPPTVTVVDVIVNSPDHNTLEAAVIAAGLAPTLSGTGPFTVFAPTDGAFANLPPGLVAALLADPMGELKDILLYHAVAGKALSTSLANGQKIVTLNNGKQVTVTINANGVYINDAKVTVTDIVADNGVVHVIEAVMLPPAVTVVDIIVNSPDHNTLETAVIASGLDPILKGSGPFTVFAPTDAAFAALPPGTVAALLADPMNALTNILLYHTFAGKALSTSLTNNQSITTINGKNVTVTINANGVFINNAKVTVADIVADNGVVHVIDAVLIPPTVTVVDVIVNSPDHTTLEAAVIAAGLAPTLSGTGPFTVFAPTDAAFAALPAGTVQALLADPTGALTQILLYHAVAGKALSTDLSNNQVIKTINGKNVTVTINANGVFINNAKVTVADIVADNGVVHVIDAVMIPPTVTVVDVIVNSPDHTTLEAAVIAAGLAPTLSGTGPFTVFAPTDAAFAALPAGTVQALLADPTGALKDILLYHAVAGKALSTSLTNNQSITTINGKNVTVTINANGVFINNAKVTVADIVADNGVVHVIDAVLLPPVSTKNAQIESLTGLFPLPTLDRVFISELPQGDVFFKVTDLNGKTVITGLFDSTNSVDVSNLPTGTYLLSIQSEQTTKVGRFIKI